MIYLSNDFYKLPYRIMKLMEQSSVSNDGKKNNSESNIRHKNLNLILLVAAIVLGAAIVMAIWLNAQRSNSPASGASSSAETILYAALANAAKQQRLRVGMYRETFATKADADTRKNVGTVASSVSEVDIKKGFRSVFANNILEEDGSYTIGRCVDGTTYNDYYQPPAKNTARAKTLQEAAGRLLLIPEGNLYKVTQPLTFITCPHLGLLPASPPVAMARLSDGVFPVTLTEAQARDWQQKIAAAKLFSVKDEGTVQRDGNDLRKISLAPHDESTTQKLYDIFYETAEIAKTKLEQPKAEVDYEFQSMNPNNTGGVGGYYLINERQNLPVYSELYGTNPDKTDDSRAAKRNIAHTKQTYTFPNQLSLDLDTPLEFL